jgi:hypothetical protein
MMLKYGFCTESGLQVLPTDEKEIERQLCDGLEHINKSPILQRLLLAIQPVMINNRTQEMKHQLKEQQLLS